MKFLILALFVAAATAAPLDDDSGAVEFILNGVAEGEPLDLSDVLDIKVKEHENGQVVAATNLLHPYTAVGIAEAAAAAAAANPEPIIVADQAESNIIVPEPVVLPSPVAPEVVIPEPVVLPEPIAPEVVFDPQPVVLPPPVAPEVAIPGDDVSIIVVSPGAASPEISPIVVAPEIVSPEVLEAIPASLPNGEIFNDGTVSVTVNTPQEAGVLSTIQSWFSLVLNYFSDGAQTTHQVV